MSQTLRVHTIDRMLRNRHHVTLHELLDELEVSLPTVKRDLAFMRLHLNAPIVFDKALKAYRFDDQPAVGPRYELPGLWLDPSEAYALLTAHGLLESLEPRLLGPHIGPIKDRLMTLIAGDGMTGHDISERIQVVPSLRRNASLSVFEVVAQATLKGHRLRICYLDPMTHEVVTREQSPQRLTYYRENWFLDAWCHDQQAFRNLAIDAMTSADMLDTPAQRFPKADVDAVLNNGYGTVIGHEQQWVVLDFSPERAAYLNRMTWADEVTRTALDNGWCRVEFAYNNDQELIWDILSHGADVVVQAPESLRQRIQDVLARSSQHYT